MDYKIIQFLPTIYKRNRNISPWSHVGQFGWSNLHAWIIFGGILGIFLKITVHLKLEIQPALKHSSVSGMLGAIVIAMKLTHGSLLAEYSKPLFGIQPALKLSWVKGMCWAIVIAIKLTNGSLHVEYSKGVRHITLRPTLQFDYDKAKTILNGWKPNLSGTQK